MAANVKLVELVNKCCHLLELQTNSIREDIEQTVVNVMEDIHVLSDQTAKAREKAEKAIDDTFLNPDGDTEQMVGETNVFVDDVLEDGDVDQDGQDLVSANVLRFGGRFVKHMRAISNLDNRVRSILMEMMAVLSLDDIMAQKLSHLTQSLEAFKVFLSYLLIDFDNRASRTHIDFLKEDLERFTWNTYSSTEERDIHAKIFGKEFNRRIEPRATDRFLQKRRKG